MRSFWTLVLVGVTMSALTACGGGGVSDAFRAPPVSSQEPAAVTIVNVFAPSSSEYFGSEAFVF